MNKLARKLPVLVAAVLTESTLEAAARRAGVAPSSLRRWAQTPEFQRELAAAKQQLLDRTLDRIADAALARESIEA